MEELDVVLRKSSSEAKRCEDGIVLRLLTDGALDKSPSSSLLELSAADPWPTTEAAEAEAESLAPPPGLEEMLELEPPATNKLFVDGAGEDCEVAMLLLTELKCGTKGSKRPWRTTSSRLWSRTSSTEHKWLELK